MLVLFVILVVKCVPWDFKVWNSTPGRNLFLFDVWNLFYLGKFDWLDYRLSALILLIKQLSLQFKPFLNMI